jgi:hypothetical protein
MVSWIGVSETAFRQGSGSPALAKDPIRGRGDLRVWRHRISGAGPLRQRQDPTSEISGPLLLGHDYFGETPESGNLGIQRRVSFVEMTAYTLAVANAKTGDGTDGLTATVAGLRDQLGLKLERTRTAVEILVIEHVEKNHGKLADRAC